MSDSEPEPLVRDAERRVQVHTRRARPSPRLKKPRHHRVVREGAKRRRRAIQAAGVMLIVASALGFVTAAGIVAQASNTHASPLPGQPVEVAGTVTDMAGAALVDAYVRVVEGSNESRTNADGWYFLGSLPPGTYNIEASKPGYQTVQRTVVLRPAFPREVDFALADGNGTVEGPSDRVATFTDPTAGVLALAVAVVLCSGLCAAAGVSAILHRHYLLAVAGAAAGVLTIGFFVGTALAIVALAILASLKTGFIEAEHHRIPWEGKLEAAGKADEARK